MRAVAAGTAAFSNAIGRVCAQIRHRRNDVLGQPAGVAHRRCDTTGTSSSRRPSRIRSVARENRVNDNAIAGAPVLAAVPAGFDHAGDIAAVVIGKPAPATGRLAAAGWRGPRPDVHVVQRAGGHADERLVDLRQPASARPRCSAHRVSPCRRITTAASCLQKWASDPYAFTRAREVTQRADHAVAPSNEVRGRPCPTRYPFRASSGFGRVEVSRGGT